jgi:hypothetical protein
MIYKLFALRKAFYFFIFFSIIWRPTRQIEENSIVLSNLKSEFNTFLKKYKSNSCIMEVFQNFRDKCEELNDEINSYVAYRMTICIFQKLNKEVPLINCQQFSSDCVKVLNGDMWTTYTTFSQHIDNICFYYKTLLWEKSTEFLFQKLSNASFSVLSELSQSTKLAEKIIIFQNSLQTQMQSNIKETVKSFENINKFMENYARVEEELRFSMSLISSQVRKNNKKIENIVQFVDNKFELFNSLQSYFWNLNESSSFFYFFMLFCVLYMLSHIYGLRGSRVWVIIFIIIFYLFEKYFISNNQDRNYSIFGIVYAHFLLYGFRCIYFFILVLIILLKRYDCPTENDYLETNRSIRQLRRKDHLILAFTPLWMKRYFEQLSCQNEFLAEKFNSIKKRLDRI